MNLGRSEQDLWMGFVTRFENKYQTGGLQHLLGWQIRKEVGSDIFNSYYKFTVVRNPWDRTVSQFAYMQQRPDLMEFLGMNLDTEFKSYLELICLKKHVLLPFLKTFATCTPAPGSTNANSVGNNGKNDVVATTFPDLLVNL